jgi:hypothetical protein
MKFKTSLLVLSLAAWATTAAEAGSPDPFHAARSAPERALDAIIRRSDKDEKLFDYILKRPGYDATKEAGYSRLFTPGLLQAWARAEAELVKQECGGRYIDGEICGIDYSPITCDQDASENGHLYRTRKIAGDAVVVASRRAGRGSPAEGPRYRLTKSGRDWKLDGVDCGDGVTFNMN